MDVTTSVSLGMINYAVDVLGVQALVGLESVGVNFGPWLYVFSNLHLQGAALGAGNYLRANLAVPLKQSHDCNLTGGARTSYLLSPLILVHVAGQAADVGFVGLYFAR